MNTPNSMSIAEAKLILPQAFVTEPSARVSDRYSFIPTSQILEDLDKLGWKIRQIQNPKYKSKAKQLHGKHLVRLFHPDVFIADGEDVNFVEIALYNSSDGLSRYRMEVGIFRFVCENGLVVKTEDFGTINTKHVNYSFEAMSKAINDMLEGLPDVVGRINKFAARELTQSEMTQLAQSAYNLRHSGRQATPEEIEGLLAPRREADQGTNLWVTLNRIQESLLIGGSLQVDARGRMRTAKPIKNLDKALRLNTGVWELAEELV